MAELDTIAETLRRQRQDIDDLMDHTATRRGETTALVSKIEELRRRSEETLRRFEASAEGSRSKAEK